MTKRGVGITIAIATLSFCIILIFYIPGFYTLPSNDDYSNAVYIQNLLQEGYTPLGAATYMVADGFMNKGFPPAVFFGFFFSPLTYIGIEGLRLTICLINLLFLVSLYCLADSVVQSIFLDRRFIHRLTVFFCLLVCTIGYDYNAQIFSWLTCSFGYLLPISAMIFGLCFYLNANAKGGWWRWMLSVVFGAVGAVGTTQISALTCGLYILACLFTLFHHRKVERKGAILSMVIILLLSIGCLFSPGIYARHDSVVQSYSLLDTLQTSVLGTLTYFRLTMASPFSIVLLVAALLTARWVEPREKVRVRSLVLALLFAVFAPIIVAFPVPMGGYNYFPDRTVFLIKGTLQIGWSIVVVEFTLWLKARNLCPSFDRKTVLSGSMLLLILCVGVISSRPIQQYSLLKITDDYFDGEFAEIDSYWMDNIHTWEQSAGKDVTLYQEDENGYKSNFLVVPDIAWDETYWNNQAVAEFYGMHSIKSIGKQ